MVRIDPRASPAETVASVDRQIQELEAQIDELSSHAIETICGATDESQEVELYDGTLGVSRDFVKRFEGPSGQLKWLDDLAARYTAPDDPGNVAGQRWGSGGLIAKDLFLTAGHCFDSSAGAWGFPRRNGLAIAPPEIAKDMEVSFRYQVDGSSPSKTVRKGERFPVLELLEHRVGGLDYAIVRLGPGTGGALPGDRFGWYEVATSDLVVAGSMLCLFEHPNGDPKRIEAGSMRDNLGGRITYDSIDTTGGSSGSLILQSPSGQVVGVHTNGGCTRMGGFNFGVAVGLIRQASPYYVVGQSKAPVVRPAPVVSPAPVVRPAPVVSPAPVVRPLPIVSPVPIVTPVPVVTSPRHGVPDREARLARLNAFVAALEQAFQKT